MSPLPPDLLLRRSLQVCRNTLRLKFHLSGVHLTHCPLLPLARPASGSRHQRKRMSLSEPLGKPCGVGRKSRHGVAVSLLGLRRFPTVLFCSTFNHIHLDREKTAKIDCTHFNFGDGDCPFGEHCFYRHADREGGGRGFFVIVLSPIAVPSA